MSTALILALVLLVAAITFPLLVLGLRPKRGAATPSSDDLVGIKASILFWNTALPTLLLLLGALGVASYNEIVKKVSVEVKQDYDKFIKREVIEALATEIKVLRDSSKIYEEDIETLLGNAAVRSQAMDSILRSTRANAGEIASIFVQALPRGAIIPYFGTSYNFDNTLWALCDGSNGTPDLRDRFILGSSFENVGSRGGDEQHNHSISLDIDGTVAKKSSTVDSRFGAPSTGGVPFKVEKHEHVFNITKEKATIGAASQMPPFYRLVYLMKIK